MSLKRVFKSILFSIFVCSLSLSCGGCSYSLPKTGVVKWVIDGDTVVLQNGERVRYLGIDTPEITSNQVWAKEAWEYNRRLVAGKRIYLEYDQIKRDRYNRLLAFVWVGKEMINKKLVRKGLAYVYYIFPNEKYAKQLVRAQEEAMRDKVGLWRHPGIVSPGNLRDWDDYTRAVKGEICRVFSSGKGIYLLFTCFPENWAGFYLPYSRFVGVDLERYRNLMGMSVIGVGKVRCSRSHCRVLILDRYQMKILKKED